MDIDTLWCTVDKIAFSRKYNYIIWPKYFDSLNKIPNILVMLYTRGVQLHIK